MATAADRLARVEALVAHLRAAYPDEGFSLHESVTFAAAGAELRATARGALKRGEIAMVPRTPMSRV